VAVFLRRTSTATSAGRRKELIGDGGFDWSRRESESVRRNILRAERQRECRMVRARQGYATSLRAPTIFSFSPTAGPAKPA
jgi:hypothetical protein